MIVIPGTASTMLAKALAETLDATLAEVEAKKFPDGENYIRLHTEVKGERVVIVQTTHPDDRIIELFLLQDCAREMGAGEITTIIPYYGYGRQDKLFNPGEVISAKTIAKRIEMESDRVITVDIHAKGVLGWFSVPVEDVSGIPPLARRLREEGVDMILSPDKGAVGRARTAAEIIGCPWDFMEKTRIDGHTVTMKAKNLDVKGATVAIVDDIIATGGTMRTAADHLKRQGADRVIAACTHGLFASNALPRLEEVFDLIISTDTIENPTTSVTVAGELARIL
ncbi:MAG: ribose-phosphate diphosphokinase [Thermoplasmata archaeon]|nr:ribose-phosphate diphosphokinase [Thermoplasmata archaeon]